MITQYPAIVIPAYNRPDCLQRLLGTLLCAKYPVAAEIPLIISIDGGGDTEVLRIAEEFNWQHGKKNVTIKKQNLGLKKHIISCGDLTNIYDNVICIEDDLVLSPYFMNYVIKWLESGILNQENIIEYLKIHTIIFSYLTNKTC